VLLPQPFRCRQNRFARFFKTLNTLRVVAYHNLLNNSLDNFQNRLGQRATTAPAIRSIAPLDEFAVAATNLLALGS
jgi:hypothetical protein